MKKFYFVVKRDGSLYHDFHFIDRFADANAAANMAIRFAQDNDALYEIDYQ